ncbi:MAG: hypothetical protein Q9M94_03745 [Candidatus Gracilibacteria bacterium]|nr:hypothetical protein [Candidatus Gracilibacteria bacterium]
MFEKTGNLDGIFPAITKRAKKNGLFSIFLYDFIIIILYKKLVDILVLYYNITYYFLNESIMGETIKNMLNGAGSLLDFTGENSRKKLESMIPRRGIGKHTRGIKRHFDKAYSQINK